MLGWMDALEKAAVVPTVLQARSNREEEANDLARSLLTAEERPTAVLCFSDVLALGVIRAAEALGLSVPGELSVVGFDDSSVARHSKPTITTVRQDVDAKGRLAATALTTAIEHARTGSRARARHHLLPTELVVRESSARPPRQPKELLMADPSRRNQRRSSMKPAAAKSPSTAKESAIRRRRMTA
jgi:DNA-binding LacI/PurR family transcriptional regulator